jgi:hypothetical protein
MGEVFLGDFGDGIDLIDLIGGVILVKDVNRFNEVMSVTLSISLSRNVGQKEIGCGGRI